MRITLRGCRLLMDEHLPDHGQALAVRCGNRGEVVTRTGGRFLSSANIPRFVECEWMDTIVPNADTAHRVASILDLEKKQTFPVAEIASRTRAGGGITCLMTEYFTLVWRTVLPPGAPIFLDGRKAHHVSLSTPTSHDLQGCG